MSVGPTLPCCMVGLMATAIPSFLECTRCCVVHHGMLACKGLHEMCANHGVSALAAPSLLAGGCARLLAQGRLLGCATHLWTYGHQAHVAAEHFAAGCSLTGCH